MTEVLAALALAAAMVRGLVVLNGLAMMFFLRQREIQWGRTMRIALPEPFLLVAASAWLAFRSPIAPMSDAWFPVIFVGGLASLFGAVLFVWSLAANRGVGTGHYTEEGQVVVTSGPYAIVRHPLYSAAIFLWLGLALTQMDWGLLVITYAYVIPAYFFYARDEEEMMTGEFGPAYADYREQVHMLFPGRLAVWD